MVLYNVVNVVQGTTVAVFMHFLSFFLVSLYGLLNIPFPFYKNTAIIAVLRLFIKLTLESVNKLSEINR